MKRSLTLFLSVLFLLSTVLVVHEARGGVDKEKCQSAMNDYIQQKIAAGGGKYDIEGKKAEFDSIHEQVREKGSNLYESCAHFNVGKDRYDIDYHVKDEGGTFTVVKEVLHKINDTEVNRVLWEMK